MGRLVGKPLNIPAKVEVELADRYVKVNGALGKNSFKLPVGVVVKMENNTLAFNVRDKEISPALVGLSYKKVENIIKGVTEKFKKTLEINGVGYRWSVSGNKLDLQIGFSHKTIYHVPELITLTIKDNTLTVEGIDKQKVGEVAADIKKFRPVEPYKGKGIKYVGEYVVRKQGKAGSSK